MMCIFACFAIFCLSGTMVSLASVEGVDGTLL